MRIMAFVGPAADRYHAEKMFGKPPEVNLVKSYESSKTFLEDLRRDEHLLHTAILCLPDEESETIKQMTLSLEPTANVIKYAGSE